MRAAIIGSQTAPIERVWKVRLLFTFASRVSGAGWSVPPTWLLAVSAIITMYSLVKEKSSIFFTSLQKYFRVYFQWVNVLDGFGRIWTDLDANTGAKKPLIRRELISNPAISKGYMAAVISIFCACGRRSCGAPLQAGPYSRAGHAPAPPLQKRKPGQLSCN